MFEFNIYIIFFTLLVVITAIYLKLYRTAVAVAVAYFSFSLITYISTDKLETIPVKNINDSEQTIMELTKDVAHSNSLDSIVDTFEVQKNIESFPVNVASNILNNLEIRSFKICKNILVENREPIGVDTVFSISDTDKLFCFTGINNSGSEIKIIKHIWKYQNAIKASISMEVSPSLYWRCWSQKQINSSQKGKWSVIVIDIFDNILDEKSFIVK